MTLALLKTWTGPLTKCLILLSLSLVGCTRNLNNLIPVGRYCGQSTAPYENPYDNSAINEETFNILTPEDLNVPGPLDQVPLASGPQTYRAQSVNILFKNTDFVPPVSPDGSYVPDEQVLYVHSPVFNQENVSLTNFNKSCSRGRTPESEASFAAILPLEIELQPDFTWTAMQALNYKVEYSPELQPQGFLVGTVEELTTPIPANEGDFAFVNLAFLEQIGQLSQAQREVREDPEKLLNEIFLQVQVSADPEIFARIRFLLVVQAEETSAADSDLD